MSVSSRIGDVPDMARFVFSEADAANFLFMLILLINPCLAHGLKAVEGGMSA